ncbi:Polysaccharide export protein [Nitrosococcus oceani ATCC 19707]|uniref:Polysaccharide export protein n=2 Tax=Nitrosococcus oceani TaxID=1229 RepID=Q3JAY6_NITOC|nr:Polysaccharide export protein [Nitrosococcus oceani ATCC 19707]
MSSRKRLSKGCRRILCFLIIGLLAACGASTPSREATSPLPESTTSTHSSLSPQAVEEKNGYRIGPSDLLQIDVFQVPELSRAVRVSAEGVISLPLIGAIQVNNLTSQELEDLLGKRLREKYLQDPQVSVFIEEYVSQRVTVEGAVEKPGIYPIQGRTTLLQALASAEGVNKVADLEGIKLFRPTGNNTKQILYYNIEAIREGVVPDPKIYADDIIVVEESGTKVFFDELSNYVRFFANPFIFF